MFDKSLAVFDLDILPLVIDDAVDTAQLFGAPNGHFLCAGCVILFLVAPPELGALGLANQFALERPGFDLHDLVAARFIMEFDAAVVTVESDNQAAVTVIFEPNVIKVTPRNRTTFREKMLEFDVARLYLLVMRKWRPRSRFQLRQALIYLVYQLQRPFGEGYVGYRILTRQ